MEDYKAQGKAPPHCSWSTLVEIRDGFPTVAESSWGRCVILGSDPAACTPVLTVEGLVLGYRVLAQLPLPPTASTLKAYLIM